MSDFVFYLGLAVAIAASVWLAVFAIRQYPKQKAVQDVPMRYDEWKAQYHTKRWYIMLTQLAGVIIAIIGLNL